MVSAKQHSVLMLAIGSQGLSGLQFRVSVIGFEVAGDGLAAGAVAHQAEEGVADTGFLICVL